MATEPTRRRAVSRAVQGIWILCSGVAAWPGAEAARPDHAVQQASLSSQTLGRIFQERGRRYIPGPHDEIGLLNDAERAHYNALGGDPTVPMVPARLPRLEVVRVRKLTDHGLPGLGLRLAKTEGPIAAGSPVAVYNGEILPVRIDRQFRGLFPHPEGFPFPLAPGFSAKETLAVVANRVCGIASLANTTDPQHANLEVALYRLADRRPVMLYRARRPIEGGDLLLADYKTLQEREGGAGRLPLTAQDPCELITTDQL